MVGLIKLVQVLRNMGMRYVGYRILHQVRSKIGWYPMVFLQHARVKSFMSFAQWASEKKNYFFDKPDNVCINIGLSEAQKIALSDVACKIRNGVFVFFNSQEFSLGENYDWVTNPLNGYVYPSTLHWSKINDYDSLSGDIKFVWEKSRFSFLYSLIRDEHINGNDHREFILSQISEWIDANPINSGPNWKCSQEISIRVLNWIFVLYYYGNKAVIEEGLWQKILNSIYHQVTHVYKHINFSRIAVRNNHAITETLTLYIVGLLFPWMDEKGVWKENGKKWFEQEIAYQVYPDGTFLQFSMNYHRVTVQLLTKAIVLSTANGESFSDKVYERAYSSVNFLYQCQNLPDGRLPNYGANDGALFFPLNSCDYRDYRPQLNALHYVLTGSALYSEGIWLEDIAWLAGKIDSSIKRYKKIDQKSGIISFPDGGYYLIREKESLTFLRAGSHKDRPSQADNLHLDIWYKSENIFQDGGSYKYNDPDKELIRYFTGTASHNTVMMNGSDQMLKGDRFMWFYWTQVHNIHLEENDAYYCIDVTISAFRQLDRNCRHRRVIKKMKHTADWVVEDFIYSDMRMQMEQLWHTCERYLDHVFLQSEGGDGSKLVKVSKQGWVSSLYGMKEPSIQLSFSTETASIKTSISIKK